MRLTYSKADTRAQDFSQRYPGARIKGNVVVLHTTETGGWPGYSGGASAPHVTVYPDRKRKRLIFRQHFSLDESARALQNDAGGVETNTLNALQIELIGTCAREYRDKYGYFYWPDAPRWALKQLAAFMRELGQKCPDLPLKDAAPRGWLSYPSSYGNRNGQRMSFAEWRDAYGIVGHQHVPENDHGDPGAFPIGALVQLIESDDAPVAVARDDVQREPTRVQRARALLHEAREIALKQKRTRRAERIAEGLSKIPKG